MQTFIITLLIIAILFLIFAFAGGFYMYRFATVRNDKSNKDYWTRELKKTDYFTDEEFAMIKSGESFIKSEEREAVCIESHDGLRLSGHIIENPSPVGVIIMVHGYRSHPILDFSCAVEPYFNNGFTMLLITQRAHCDSGGKHIGFGVLERYDVVRWVDYAKNRWPDLPIVLDGVSMGASTIMMGGELGYPSNVKAIICDCGFTTPGAICRKVLKQWFKLPPFPLYYSAKLWINLFAKYDLEGASSVEGLKKLCESENSPCVLIAHGKKDDFVPYKMAEENREAYKKAERLWFVSSDEADHGMTYLKDKDKYVTALYKMFTAAGIQIRK